MKTNVKPPIRSAGFLALCLISHVGWLASNLPSQAVVPSISPWEKILSVDTAAGVEEDRYPEAVVSGQTIHTVWSASVGYDIHHLSYRRSTDGGKTWQNRVILQEYPYNNWTTMINGKITRLAVDGNNVHVIQRRWVDGWHYEIDYFRSTNNGATFGPKRTIASSEGAWIIEIPRIAAGGGKVVVAYGYQPNWYSNSSGHFLLSNDNGSTFGSTPVLDNGNSVYGYGYECMDIKRTAQTIVSIWKVSSNNKIIAVTSTDGGATIHTVDMPLINEAWSTNPDYMRPQLCAITGNILHVAWNQRNASGRSAMFYARSVDGGGTFTSPLDLSEGAIGTDEVRPGRFLMAAQGTRVYACYISNSGGGVWLRTSSSTGATFGPAKALHLPDTANFGNGEFPGMAIDPNDTTGATASFAFAIPSAYSGCSASAIRHTSDGGATISPLLAPAHPWIWGNGHPTNFLLLPVASPKGSVWTMLYCGSVPGLGTDLFARRFTPEPAPTPDNKVLHLGGISSTQRYDMLEVPSVPAMQFSKKLTAEMWVMATPEIELPNGSQEILQWGEAEPRSLSFRCYGGASRKVSARFLTSTGGHSIGGSNSIGDGRWHHLALTYDADAGPLNLRFYLDGHLDSTTTATGTFVPSAVPLMVGGASLGWGISPFNGAVDNLRLWNRALSENEIRNSAGKAGLTGTERGLAAAFSFDGTVKDLSGHGADGLLQFKASYQKADGVPAPLMNDWSDDFSSNELRPVYWKTNPSKLHKVDASSESVRVSKPIGGKGALGEGFTMDSVWQAEGDFDVSFDFRKAMLTRSMDHGNHLGIKCTIGATRYNLYRSDEKELGQNVRFGIDPGWWNNGGRTSTITSGNLRLIRRGLLLSSYLNGEMTYQTACTADPMTCRIELLNNGTPDAIAATFDNFEISATRLDRRWSSKPEIAVQQPAGSNLVDGTSKKSFGTVKVGKTGTAKTFTIKNTGATTLTGLAITTNGTHASNFIVTQPVKAKLAPGTSTTFKVSFKPTATGTRNAAIHIKNNDADETPFDIKLTGLGAKP